MKSNIGPSSIAPILLICSGVLLIASLPLIRHLQVAGASIKIHPATYSTGDISSISIHEAYLLLEKELAVFLDVSSQEDYQAGHIPGAKNISVVELNQGSNSLYPTTWIILYSTEPGSGTVSQAGKLLIQNGFSRVYILEGGLAEWKNQGYPVSSQP